MTRLGPIAYVSHLYPHLTETFVYREVQALRRRGVDVRTYGAWRPAEAAVSLEARGHIQETTYVFPLALPAFVASHVRFLLTRPRRYLGALFEVLAAKGDRLTVRGLGALHFLMGVHLARAMERAGAIHVHAQFSVHAATMGLVAARSTGSRARKTSRAPGTSACARSAASGWKA